MICASCGLDREDGSRARGIELVGVEVVADVMVSEIVCLVEVIDDESERVVFHVCYFYCLHCDSKDPFIWLVS